VANEKRGPGVAAPLGGLDWDSYKGKIVDEWVEIEKAMMAREKQQRFYLYTEELYPAKLKEIQESGPLIDIRNRRTNNHSKNENLIKFPGVANELAGLFGGTRKKRHSKRLYTRRR
jgi:hypothetical protein